MKNKLLIISILVLLNSQIFAQKQDSITITADWGVKDESFQDYIRFEDIDYFKLNFKSEKLPKSGIILISKEFWNKKLTKTDTILNTQKYGVKIDSTNFSFRVMAKRLENDSVKFQFFYPFFHTVKKFKSLKTNIYSLRDVSNGKKEKVAFNQTFPLLAYSLPYKDPNQPNYLFYCELTAKGVPPEQWGEKYNISHYIVIECKIFQE